MVFVTPAYAQCPVCIITVGGGLLIAQKLGISDLLVSIWISGLNTVIAYFLAPKLKLKLINQPIILSLLFYVTTLIYFDTTSQLSNDSLWGMTIGLIAVLIGNFIDKFTRLKNSGKILFPYQKIVFPSSLLIISTLISKLFFSL